MRTLLFFTLLLPAISFSQEVRIRIDKLTEDTIKSTPEVKIYTKGSWKMANAGERLSFSLSKTNKLAILMLDVMTGAGRFITVREGDELNIKLSDGQIINLRSLKTVVGSTTSSGLVGSYLQPVYEITPEIAQTLQSNAITLIRMRYVDGFNDYELKDNHRTTIQKAVTALYR